MNSSSFSRSHLSNFGDAWQQKSVYEGRAVRLPTYDQALAFVRAGWAPSGAITVSGELLTPYEIPSACAAEEPDADQ
jgi:hypothetical protein